MSNPPNILWICTDQQRWDTLGVYGNQWVNTPHIDRLASRGMTFDYCYSQSSVCTPSRASFLTGRYPRTCRGRQNGANIPADELLITKILADAGYYCGLSGKLHISACNEVAAPMGERRIDDGYAVFDWSTTPVATGPTTSTSTGSSATAASIGPSRLKGARTYRPGWMPSGTRPLGA